VDPDSIQLWSFDDGAVIHVVGQEFIIALWDPMHDLFLDPEPPYYRGLAEDSDFSDYREAYRLGDQRWKRIA